MNKKDNPVFLAVYYLLQVTWGSIQNVCGLVVWLFLNIKNPNRKRGIYHGAILTYWGNSFSTGLGMFIFFGHEGSKDADEVLVHEYGHTLQSALLGPLFLPVIGIPSTVWAFTPIFEKWRKEGRYKYCQFYPEAWANSWGSKVTHQKAPDR